MKRIICIILTVILLAGCVKASDSEATTDMPEQEQLPGYPQLTLNTLPVIDGSTATIPLAEALISLLLDIPRSDAAELVNFNGTNESYLNLIWGQEDWGSCKLIISYEPTEEALKLAKEKNFEWELAPIGTDALVFIINASNPVDSITTEQVRGIYTGEITNWKELGGDDVKIEPFQRNETSGSQTLFIKLVMGDTPPMEPETQYIQGGMGGLMESVASFNESDAAIGFSVYYYAQNMNPNDGLKFLKIDGVEPTNETIKNGTYPYVNNFYTGIYKNSPADSVERQIFDWLQSEEGKLLIEHQGYVSIG